MNNYLYHIIQFINQMLHPAEGKKSTIRKKKPEKEKSFLQPTPDCYNVRGGMAAPADHFRRSPAP